MAAKTGRPAFVPTPEQRRLVEALAGYGIPQEQICMLVLGAAGKPLSKPTLEKAFRAELDAGEAKANAKVAGALFKNAVEAGNVTAQIFWLKTRLGWKEPVLLEHTGKDGGPIEAVVQIYLPDNGRDK